MWKFLTTVIYAGFIALIVGVAGLLVGTMLPIPGNIEIKIVKSGSMEPNIPTGSIVIVKPLSSYGVGDVITFGADTKTEIPTTHRIIGTEDGSFITKGDANEERDPEPVARRDVIGKVVLDVPYAGFLLDFARQPLGFALLIVIPAALVILEELLTIFRETRKWWKGRGGGMGGSAGGGGSLDLRGHARMIVYTRRRLMDDILVPMLEDMREVMARRAQARTAPLPQTDAYPLATALVVCLIFTSTFFAGASGGTLAYFYDIEQSIGNMLRAGTWEEEIEILAVEFADTQPAARTIEALDTPEPEGAVLGESTSEEDEEVSPEEDVEAPESPEPTARENIRDDTPERPESPERPEAEDVREPQEEATMPEGPAEPTEPTHEAEPTESRPEMTEPEIPATDPPAPEPELEPEPSAEQVSAEPPSTPAPAPEPSPEPPLLDTSAAE